MRATSRPSRIPESQALPILQSVEDLPAITKEKADPAGILRLGMAQGIGDFALGEAVERLRMDFPKLDLRLRTDWSAGLWLVHRRQPGNLRKALENVALSVAARIAGAAFDVPRWPYDQAHIAATLREAVSDEAADQIAGRKKQPMAAAEQLLRQPPGFPRGPA